MEAVGIATAAPKDDNRTVARSVEQASTRAHDAIDKVSDVARPAMDRVASGAHQAVDKLAGAVETLGVKGEQLKNAQARAVEQCRGYVRDHPAASLGIALAAGFLLSRLWSWTR